ncbi:hypothetical protein NOS3756_56870 (plasmid) [Nostoc sp. NIES-3756]|uniref:hypothetical protein n=1 Tax=Nostoc sp. NIES-3756 TaxID=1751286 RepID=UPI00071FEC1D|nr:hypothetical protein [Nostoc sp. NIES-3756]BAT56675.1 hypothetical protein NOS3756_56870 [Nostoc sp. NIES-3756]BAY41651.1 hypothetical protein NIES2111_60470 [Nostoc sp. NIES-2111]
MRSVCDGAERPASRYRILRVKAIAQIIKPPKMIASPPDIGYWINTSRVGVKPCAKIRFTSKLLDKPLLRENLK